MERQLVNPHWDKLVYAHRLTHIDNIPDILKVGFVHPTSKYSNPNFVPIGDPSIIRIRHNELHKGYRLSDYIPFYFGPRSPMLFVIQTGFNGVKKHLPDDVVYCVVKIPTIIEQGWECVFTDGHAVTGITEFYTKEQLKDIDNIIKVEDVYAKFWKDENDLDLTRRKQAELLIKDDIPPEFIAGFFVYSSVSKSKLISFGVDDSRICVAPDYFFSVP